MKKAVKKETKSKAKAKSSRTKTWIITKANGKEIIRTHLGKNPEKVVQNYTAKGMKVREA